MFSGANGLSGSNKAKIHSNFKSNTNWSTDWSSHVQASILLIQISRLPLLCGSRLRQMPRIFTVILVTGMCLPSPICPQLSRVELLLMRI